MMNQQLLDFVKQSLAQGVNREKITIDLVANGWTMTDINECFNSLNTPPVVQPIQPIQPIQPVQPIQNIQPTQTSQPVKPIQTLNQKPVQVSTKEQDQSEPTSIAVKIFYVLIALLLLGTIAAGYYFRNELVSIPVIKDFIVSNNIKIAGLTEDLINKEKVEEKNLIQEQKEVLPEEIENPVQAEVIPEQNPVVTTEETKTPAVVAIAPVVAKTGVIDCGKDMACFMKAIKTCSPAVVEQTNTLPIFGLIQTSDMKISLNGFNSSKKCVYLSEVLNAKLEYSQEMKNSILSEITPEIIAKKRSEPDFPEEYKNLTDEELRKKMIEVPKNGMDSVKSTIGMITKCSFTTNYLTELYTNWSKGKASSKDLDPGNCEFSEEGKPFYRSKIGLYYDDSGSSMSTDGYNLRLIKINENQIELKIIKESTKETKNITLVPKQEIKLFGATFSLQEIKKDDIGLLAQIGILKDNAKLNTF